VWLHRLLCSSLCVVGRKEIYMYFLHVLILENFPCKIVVIRYQEIKRYISTLNIRAYISISNILYCMLYKFICIKLHPYLIYFR
jgi:hypothetical protein